MSSFPSKYHQNAEASTGLIFMRTYNKWHGQVKRQLNKMGLTHPQFVVLTTIGYVSQYEKEITQAKLAVMAGMDVMSVSQILVLLEKKAWVERKRHSRDTRANAICLTEMGREKMVAALPVVEQIDADFFGSLQEKEEVFQSYLHTLNAYHFHDSSNKSN